MENKTLDEIKGILKEQMPFLEKKYNVKTIGIFGSFAKNEQEAESDVDVLVEFSNTPGLFKFINLENYLSKVLNVKVDLVTKNALKPVIKDTILQETVYL
ncbi:MAG: nucleotidyltransferase family protein [Ignavibacteriales bacterium]|nr:nucleotidyltransferase family protein [Ignavibacteriales bacterium]